MESIENIRLREDNESKSNPLSWLNLAGLFRLEEGENTFGSDESNHISLSGFHQPFCGNFSIKDGKVTFHPSNNVIFTSNKPAPETRPLIFDIDNEPDLINIGTITFKIIVRGEATFVRAWDSESPVGKQFTGFKYYPVNKEYRVTAKYVRYDPPKNIKRLDIIGTESVGQFLGQTQFSLHDMDCTLEAEKSGDKFLFHFTDATSKVTTYGGGRKFSISQPKGNKLILDFNLSENWPCAYTHFATCPVVPQENRLPIKIEAGEKKYFD